MNYSTKLSNKIRNEIKIDPTAYTPNQVRVKIEDNLDVADAVFKNSQEKVDVIGVSNDLGISYQGVNKAQDLYSEFMEVYTEYLDAQ